MAKGFHQQQGLDYTETFSPVIKSTTVRYVLHVVVNKSWRIHQFDVNNAFLQGTLSEEVYVAQPPSFIDKDHPNHVCRLKKSLYRLKQAPRAWYHELCSYLIDLGFTNSVADMFLFIHHCGKHIICVLVYVDDMLITGSNNDLITQFIYSLVGRFSLKDLGELRYFLGIEATCTTARLHLMQKKYIIDLLAKTNMLVPDQSTHQCLRYRNSRSSPARLFLIQVNIGWFSAAFNIFLLFVQILHTQ